MVRWLNRIWTWVFGLALLALVVWQGLAIGRSDGYWQDLWLSRDQQGQWFFNRGDYRQAAQRFHDPEWRAVALYASEAFAGAGSLWQRQTGLQALFNQANALAHQEEYQAAADYYQLVLQWSADKKGGADWLAARDNLELVQVLGRQPPETDAERSGEPQLGADEIVFDQDPDEPDNQDEDAGQGEGGLSSEEIQALWMRQLHTRPVDFLRLKFQYQLATDAETPAQELQP